MIEQNFFIVRRCLNDFDCRQDNQSGIDILYDIERKYLMMKYALERISHNIYGDIAPQIIAGEALESEMNE